MAIFKNGKKTFDDKIDVCNSGKKAAEIMVIGLAAFSVPTVCPIVSNYVKLATILFLCNMTFEFYRHHAEMESEFSHIQKLRLGWQKFYWPMEA